MIHLIKFERLDCLWRIYLKLCLYRSHKIVVFIYGYILSSFIYTCNFFSLSIYIYSNFAYYISLYYQTSCEKGDSLFIHIPPFETQKKEVTSSQINLIINYLVDFCSGSSSLVTQPSTLPLTPLLRGGEIKSHISINNSDKEIIDSLQSLGFNINQIKSAMSSLPLVCTVEELIERMFNLENNNEMEKEEKKESDDIKMVLVARNDLKMGKGLNNIIMALLIL